MAVLVSAVLFTILAVSVVQGDDDGGTASSTSTVDPSKEKSTRTVETIKVKHPDGIAMGVAMVYGPSSNKPVVKMDRYEYDIANPNDEDWLAISCPGTHMVLPECSSTGDEEEYENPPDYNMWNPFQLLPNIFNGNAFPGFDFLTGQNSNCPSTKQPGGKKAIDNN